MTLINRYDHEKQTYLYPEKPCLDWLVVELQPFLLPLRGY